MERPKDRLATTDEHGDRVYMYPAEAKGYFRNYRNWSQFVLILIFLILPWIRIGGEQALLLDIAERRFAIFGLTFWAHDGPLIFFILAILTLGLAFVTSIWGRFWCGWACPQTVFIDGVFRRIETFIEGNHLKRRALDVGPWNVEKILKKISKWFAFFAVSTIISHSFSAYFVGSTDLVKMTMNPPAENWTTFLVTTSITLIVLFDFGWFREQFCIIACPYGRFQSVLLDKNSTAVVYDEKRGEPRKGSEQAKATNTQGDCINCTRCVQVCPTGIDIRRGLQLECIACTACIDACDEIMTKVNKPKGLIRYGSINEMEGGKKQFTVRSFLYLTLIILAFTGLIYSVATRETLHVTMIRVPGAPYRILDENTGQIMNQYKAHIQNQMAEEMTVTMEISPEDTAAGVKMIQQESMIRLSPGEIKFHFLFIQFPKTWMDGKREKILFVKVNATTSQESKQSIKKLEILAP